MLVHDRRVDRTLDTIMEPDNEVGVLEETRDTDRPDFLLTTHDASWSANLETERYAANLDRLITDALAAIDCTQSGFHVNLVTHPAHGSPETYLAGPIRNQFPAVETTVVDQCGCGGYVYRIQR